MVAAMVRFQRGEMRHRAEATKAHDTVEHDENSDMEDGYCTVRLGEKANCTDAIVLRDLITDLNYHPPP